MESVRNLDGVGQIAVLGSIVTAKPSPKDIDVLVMVDDHTDLVPLATYSRQLKGYTQSINKGTDVFLSNQQGKYIGRVCRWKICHPGVRVACNALHCGLRPYLNDDLSVVKLSVELVHHPPVTLWPVVEIRCPLPEDFREWISQF